MGAGRDWRVTVLKHIAKEYDGKPPVTVRLVDWADEEARDLGEASSGLRHLQGLRRLTRIAVGRMRQASGLKMRCGVRVRSTRIGDAGKERKMQRAYLELHIEQGPVLESLNLPLGAVLGTKGVERHLITFHGQEAHSGSTPMKVRRDAHGGSGECWRWRFGRLR